MSQDPLELFFGCVRSSLGFNNNPTVVQFQGAYKKLCAGALLKTGEGANCLWAENMGILVRPVSDSSCSKVKEGKKSSEAVLSQYENQEYKSDILTYIAGNAQRKILEKVDCDNCFSFIMARCQKLSCGLIDIKDIGGLIRPSADIVKIVQIVDKLIEEVSKCEGLTTSNLFTNSMLVRLMMHIHEHFPFLMDNMCMESSHKVGIMKMVVSYYLNVKIGHLCKTESNKFKNNIRHIHRKMPIFNHE